MCTSMAFQSHDFYFGRNMDIEYSFGEQVVVVPRNYPIPFQVESHLHQHYAMVGMAHVEDGVPLFAEAVNEKGLCMAGLNFPGNAWYPKERAADKYNITPYEIIPWILGRCASVEEAREKLEHMHFVAIPFRETLPLTPLHWMITDKKESIVLEPTRDGLHIYENPVGVLTNNPTFDYQLMNLNHYLNLTSGYPKNRFGGDVELSPFGQGLGGFGLPGDFSPASRFVKTAFLKSNSVCEQDENSSVAQVFHILDGVAMVQGSVITQEGKCDITTYSCCVNADQGIYYYKTYGNNQISAVDMHREDLEGTALAVFDLIKEQQIFHMN